MAKQDKNLLVLLYQKWNIEPVKIILAKAPFSLKNTMFNWYDLKHHKWYDKDYKKYLYDAHSDIQLKNDNLPDVLRNSINNFNDETFLNSNYGKLKGTLRDFDGIFPKKDLQSNLFQGIFTFSKGFLLENYVVNKSQEIADVIFDAFCKFNHLVKDEWVFQAALHKNTSIFHIHYRMYQIKGAQNLRTKNFSASCLKFVKEEVFAWFYKNGSHNNFLFKPQFKLQQAYIRFAQETSLFMGLTNSMLDLALTNKYNFNDDFKHWIINLAIIQPHHMQQYQLFQQYVQQTNTSIFVQQKTLLDEELKNKTITKTDYNTILKKWKDNLKALYDNLINQWIRQWEANIASQIINLWSRKVDDICTYYEDIIKSNQNFHTLSKYDKQLTYLDFSQFSNNIRLLQHKAILYLTSMYIFDTMFFNDSELYNQVNKYSKELNSISSLYTIIQQAKDQEDEELSWKSINQMILKLKK